MNYYISDLHFGHYNIIKLCNRPFTTVEEMNETLIKNWNDTITDNDTIYVVGDFAFLDVEKALAIRNRLKGKIVLIEGNHDIKNLKNPKFRTAFDEVHQLLTIVDHIDDKDYMIALCHYPIVEWNGYFRNSYHIFGHIHNNTRNKSYEIVRNEPRALNCGCEITNYRPMTLEELIKVNDVYKRRSPK